MPSFIEFLFHYISRKNNCIFWRSRQCGWCACPFTRFVRQCSKASSCVRIRRMVLQEGRSSSGSNLHARAGMRAFDKKNPPQGKPEYLLQQQTRRSRSLRHPALPSPVRDRDTPKNGNALGIRGINLHTGRRSTNPIPGNPHHAARKSPITGAILGSGIARAAATSKIEFSLRNSESRELLTLHQPDTCWAL